MGAELESEYTPVEAGLARPKVKSADFIGKAAYLGGSRGRRRQRSCARCRSIDHTSASGINALPDRRQRADPHPRR